MCLYCQLSQYRLPKTIKQKWQTINNNNSWRVHQSALSHMNEMESTAEWNAAKAETERGSNNNSTSQPCTHTHTHTVSAQGVGCWRYYVTFPGNTPVVDLLYSESWSSVSFCAPWPPPQSAADSTSLTHLQVPRDALLPMTLCYASSLLTTHLGFGCILSFLLNHVKSIETVIFLLICLHSCNQRLS